MSLFSGILQEVVGAAAIVGGILTAQPELVTMGIGEAISGIGTLIDASGHSEGKGTTVRNPISPWKVAYGRCRVGGTIVYWNPWGESNNFLDLVMVLASHPCALGLGGEAVADDWPQEFADQARLTKNTTNVDSVNAETMSGHLPGALPGSGTTFSPAQTVVNISGISRSPDNDTGQGSGVVTVTLQNPIPYLQSGDQIKIQNVGSGATEALNGTFTVAEVLANNGTTGWTTQFTYLQGGPAVTISNQGQCVTLWANYSNLINIEYLDGTQKLGETFQLASRSIDDNNGNTIPNPWTSFCSLQGKTAVMLRLYFNAKFFPTGTYPQFSFHIRGKNNIYDPRKGPLNADGSVNPAYCVYTENAALCIADFLTTPLEFGGYGVSYGTDIPLDALSNTANTCDLPVPLAAGGTEPLYALNGSFDLDRSRGEILQDMLTACAGRLSIVGGQYFIFPGYWDNNYNIKQFDLYQRAAGEIEWKPAPSIRELYNGVRGTYISPFYNWTSTDFPYYAQDRFHGYDPGNLLPQYNGDINLAADGGERRWLDIHLPFTISAATAQRLAKVELLRRRWYGTGTFVLDTQAYQFVPMDIIAGNMSFLGFDQENLEIENMRLTLRNGGAIQVEMDLQQTDSSIYQWSVEEELSPFGYVQGNWGTPNYTETAPFPWSAGYANALYGDVFEGESATFGLQTVYSQDQQGNASNTLQIKGQAPFTTDPEISGPELHLTVGTGGTIPAGNYVLSAASFNNGEVATQQLTEYLDIIKITIPSDGGSIAYQILWGSGNDGGALYMANAESAKALKLTGGQAILNAISQDLAYEWHFQHNVSPGDDLGQTTGTLTSFNQSTPGGPDKKFDHFEVVWNEIVHDGCWANTVVSLTANTVTVGGANMTNNQWAGYTLTLQERTRYVNATPPPVPINPELIVLNMPIIASTASVAVGGGFEFTMTVGPNSLHHQLPDLRTLINVNDNVVMRMNPIFTPNSFSDKNVANGYYPDGATNVETGHVAVVYSGVDYGDVVPISSVGTDSNGKKTIFKLAHNWAIQPSPGDIIVIVDPTTKPSQPTQKITVINPSAGPSTISEATIQNLPYQQWLIVVRTCSATGLYVPDMFAPMRDIYISGSQGTRTITATTTMAITDGTILADATAGDIVYTLLPFTLIPNQNIFIQKTDTSSHTVTVDTALVGGLLVDKINGVASVTLSGQWDNTSVKVGGS